MATAIVTGITGQDGSYLVEQLLQDGHQVIGIVRNQDVPVVPAGIEIERWDFANVDALCKILRVRRPAAFYNFAAYSTGAGMYDDPIGIGELNGIAVARILQAIVDSDAGIRFCQASSSEMFGNPPEVPQSESTPFRPLSPYGAAKLFAHTAVGSYRARHGVFACSAILYNHESPRRGIAFVTRKIAEGVARIKLGLQQELRLGHLDASRDWGYAPDYVRAMRLMLSRNGPDDYIVATGEAHSVREFCDVAFAHVGLDYREHIKENPEFMRHDGRAPLVGDASKARAELGWAPEVDFAALVRIMVDAELESISLPDANT